MLDPDRTKPRAPSEEDEPLDPAVERVRAKLTRLVQVSIGTLLIGILAVLGAVLYKFNTEPSTRLAGGADGLVEREIDLLPGASLTRSQLAPNGLMMEIALPDGSTELVVLDPASARVRMRVVLRPGER